MLEVCHQDVDVLELDLGKEAFKHCQLVVHEKGRVNQRLEQRAKHPFVVLENYVFLIAHNAKAYVHLLPSDSLEEYHNDDVLLDTANIIEIAFVL